MIHDKNPRAARAKGYLNCWVCEGWREKEFTLTKIVSTQHIVEPVYIHFDFDEYLPSILTRDPRDPNSWKIMR